MLRGEHLFQGFPLGLNLIHTLGQLSKSVMSEWFQVLQDASGHLWLPVQIPSRSVQGKLPLLFLSLSLSLSFLTFSFSVFILFAFLFLRILLTYPLAQRFLPRMGPVYQQAHQWHSSFFVTLRYFLAQRFFPQLGPVYQQAHQWHSFLVTVFLILIISFWFFFRTSWKISLLTLLSILACCLLYPLEPSLLYPLIIVVWNSWSNNFQHPCQVLFSCLLSLFKLCFLLFGMPCNFLLIAGHGVPSERNCYI